LVELIFNVEVFVRKATGPSIKTKFLTFSKVSVPNFIVSFVLQRREQKGRTRNPPGALANNKEKEASDAREYFIPNSDVASAIIDKRNIL